MSLNVRDRSASSSVPFTSSRVSSLPSAIRPAACRSPRTGRSTPRAANSAGITARREHRQRARARGGHQRLDIGLLGVQRQLGVAPDSAEAAPSDCGTGITDEHRVAAGGRRAGRPAHGASRTDPELGGSPRCAAVRPRCSPGHRCSGRRCASRGTCRPRQLDPEGVQLRLGGRAPQLGSQSIDLSPGGADRGVLGSLQDGVAGLAVGQRRRGQRADGGHQQERDHQPGPQPAQRLTVDRPQAGQAPRQAAEAAHSGPKR